MGCDRLRQQKQQQQQQQHFLTDTYPALYDHKQTAEDASDPIDRPCCFRGPLVGTGSIMVWLVAPTLLWIYVALSFLGADPPVTQGLTWRMVNISILMFVISAYWFQWTVTHSGRQCLLVVEDNNENDDDDDDDDHRYQRQDNNDPDQADSTTDRYNETKRWHLLIPELAMDVVLALVLLGQVRLAFQILLSTSIGLLSMLLACYVLRKCYPEQEEKQNQRTEKVWLYRGSSLRPEDGLTPTVTV